MEKMLKPHQEDIYEKTNKYIQLHFNLLAMYGGSYMFRYYIVILKERS
jgi:hypothetical protein